ncbi:hypothetical protein [Tenacibaculum aiptasiae]|uniref:hypothetical protein n=1 Tax=Tenacibaculum aiptasiae TaxID=426481 RepID=UPI00232F4AB1|nr:hypothetical protein [Tenacibaculum aiptasiae]
MRNFWIIFFFISAIGCSVAQDIVAKSKALIEVKKKLVVNRDSILLQNEYLKLFPSSEKEFKDIFHSEESLLHNKEIEYCYLLASVFKSNADDAGLRLINICTDFPERMKGKYDTGTIREVMMIYAYRYPDSFILNFNNLTKQKKRKLFTYLADVESHEFYRAYHMLLDKYKSLNKGIAEYLIKYRDLRIKDSHH